MKNKTAMYVSLAILLVVIIGGFFVIKALTSKASNTTPPSENTTSLPPVDSSVQINLVPRNDGKAVILSVSAIPVGTDSIEYELSYLTGAGLLKGAAGKIELGGKSNVEKEILLGTCSRSTCTYDSGVTSVKLTLKFHSSDGASLFTKEYSLVNE